MLQWANRFHLTEGYPTVGEAALGVPAKVLVQMPGLKGLNSFLGSGDREWTAEKRGFAGGLVGRWTCFMPCRAGIVRGERRKHRSWGARG